VDHFSFVEAVDGFGECIVVTVTNTANRRFDSGFCQSFSVFDREVLAAAVRVKNEAAFVDRPSVVNGLFQSIEDKAGMGRSADPPADNIAGINVDDESDINHSGPCRDIGEV
jgi:hypothetical protein